MARDAAYRIAEEWIEAALKEEIIEIETGKQYRSA
jgi:hypothetical protein